jgi:hypothetical protein
MSLQTQKCPHIFEKPAMPREVHEETEKDILKKKRKFIFCTLFVITSHILGSDRKVSHVFNRCLLGKEK